MSEDYSDLRTLVAVKEFSDAFKTNPDIWFKLILEESKELIHAWAEVLKESADVVYVLSGAVNDHGNFAYDAAFQGEDLATVEKAMFLLTLLEVVSTHNLRMEAFERVHTSNMSKLGDDGQPVRREDGKVLKGPNYQPPFLDDLTDQLQLNLDILEAI